MERRERSCCTPDVDGAGDAARELGDTASATLRRGVRNRDSTEPRMRPAADGGAERSRLLLRDRPSLRLFLRRSASDGESGEAMVSRDLNNEQKEDFRDTPPGGGNGEGDRCGDGLRGARSVGRATRPCSVLTVATSLSSSSSYSLSGLSRIRITSLERFRLLYTSGSESRRCRERARARLLLSLRCLSPSTGTVDAGGAAGRGARSTVTSAVTSRRSRASPAGGGGSAALGATVGPALALSSRHSSTAAAHTSGSVSMGRGPQNDVSSSILCGDGERDAADATDNRDTRDAWLKPDSTECAEHCEPTLERRLVRPDTPNSAASLPWLSLREWRRESAAGGIGGATGPGPPGAPSKKANSSVEERRSSAPSSRKPSSPEAAGAPAKSASSGELSRESW